MKKGLLFLTIILATVSIYAQDAPAWSKKFLKINWYKQTDAGILIVGSSDAHYGIDPTDGKELWKLTDFDGMKEENYDPIEGSPYVALVDGGFNKKHYIIDVTTGKLIASSKDLGFNNVTKRIEAKKLGAILFYGFNSKGKPMLTAVDVSTGNKLWEQTKLFEKSSEQIVSEAGILKNGIFLATNRSVYKLNPTSGEVLWSFDIKSDVPMMSKATGFGSALGSKGANTATTATSADFFQYGDSSINYFGLGGIAAMSMAVAHAAQLSYAKGYYGSTSSSIDNAIKNDNQMTSAWGNAGISSFKSIGRRFTASKSTNNYQTILCNFGDNNTKENVGIVCINKNDGKESKRIVFSDKEPDYQLDEIDRHVFFKKGNDEIQMFTY